MSLLAIDLPTLEIESFCQRWKIDEMALFGSALTAELSTKSDVDVLIRFGEDADWGLFDHIQMEQELADMFGRPVDLITERSLVRSENWIRKEAILNSSQVIFKHGKSYHVA